MQYSWYCNPCLFSETYAKGTTHSGSWSTNKTNVTVVSGNWSDLAPAQFLQDRRTCPFPGYQDQLIWLVLPGFHGPLPGHFHFIMGHIGCGVVVPGCKIPPLAGSWLSYFHFHLTQFSILVQKGFNTSQAPHCQPDCSLHGVFCHVWDSTKMVWSHPIAIGRESIGRCLILCVFVHVVTEER